MIVKSIGGSRTFQKRSGIRAPGARSRRSGAGDCRALASHKNTGKNQKVSPYFPFPASLCKATQDYLSLFKPLPPWGIFNPMKIEKCKIRNESKRMDGAHLASLSPVKLYKALLSSFGEKRFFLFIFSGLIFTSYKHPSLRKITIIGPVILPLLGERDGVGTVSGHG